MKSSLIKKIQGSLKNYFTYSKTSDIIVVSASKEELPFAYIISDDINYPDNLLISFALDSSPAIAANLALEVDRIKEVFISESFYISNAGQTFWGEEALERFQLDHFVDLESLEAASQELN